MGHPQIDKVEAGDIAKVLTAMADLMATFQRHDLALQDALSTMAARARSSREMNNLQHIDLITQTHGDLAKLLPVLAGALKGDTVEKSDLKAKLTLRSLQDTLINDDEAKEHHAAPGELSLF